MPIKAEDEISARTRELYERALRAIDDENPKLAVELLLEVIGLEPQFLEAHKLLRATEKQRFGAKGAAAYLQKGAAKFTTLPQLGIGWTFLKQGKPKEAMIFAYKVLNQDPTNTQGLDLLIRTAAQLEIPEVAVLAAEDAVAPSPNNVRFLLTLAQLYRQVQDLPKALDKERARDLQPDEEDWELYVAFIRFDFPPAQRDVAQRLAAAFARVVGKRIIHLRPECTIQEILSRGEETNIEDLRAPITKVLLAFFGHKSLDDVGTDSRDQVEMAMSLEDELGSELPADFLGMTFRELVEHFAAKQGVSA